MNIRYIRERKLRGGMAHFAPPPLSVHPCVIWIWRENMKTNMEQVISIRIRLDYIPSGRSTRHNSPLISNNLIYVIIFVMLLFLFYIGSLRHTGSRGSFYSEASGQKRCYSPRDIWWSLDTCLHGKKTWR
jgi:hypothetical protein